MKHTIYSYFLTYKRECLFLTALALIVRSLTFYYYIQPGHYYQQPDSNDYHIAALCIRYGFGMSQPDATHGCRPMFWRTPGYPMFLAPWYYAYPPTTTMFDGATQAQEHAIWLQILLNSLIPFLVFILARMITQTYAIALMSGLIVAFHLGFTLASCYLLSEGIALIPLYLFLIYFYRMLMHTSGQWYTTITAALTLGIFTWIRPMGQFMAIVSLMLYMCLSKATIKKRTQHALLFVSIFFLSISPWYIRNHTLTGHWFFCPMFGSYLNSFCAPRAISNANNIALLDTWKFMGDAASQRYQQLQPLYRQKGLYCPLEIATADTAWPIVMRYPWYVALDWVREVCKTTFDLYSNQLVACVQGTYFYDPLIEYISEKLSECLYSVPMPYTMRFVIYLEFLYALLLWIGLIAGAYTYILQPLIQRLRVNAKTDQRFTLWILSTLLIIAVVGMTGGFGYARLRLPVEGLMIILSLTFWYHVWQQKKA